MRGPHRTGSGAHAVEQMKEIRGRCGTQRRQHEREEHGRPCGEAAHAMEFDLLDGYLLDGSPPNPRAAAFYEGLRILGARTPDLSLIALRLVLAGKTADDASVTHLREIVARARAGDASARETYPSLCSDA